jgi:hypothetical protein
VNEDRFFFGEGNATQHYQSQMTDTPPMEFNSRAGKTANRMAIMTR